MRDLRLLSGSVLICLPVLIATAVTVWGYVEMKPVYEERDRKLLTDDCREVAERLHDDPARGVTDEPLRQNHGRMLKMRPGRWGYYEEGDGRIVVWYQSGDPVRLQLESVPRPSGFGTGDLMLPVVVVLLGLFWGLTSVGCVYFRRSVKARDDFIAATAHDLTTPLVALRRLIGRDDAEAAVVAERLMRLVTNLKDFLRLSGRRPAPKDETVDLRAAYDEAYALFAEDFRWAGDGRDVTVDGPKGLAVRADATMLVQVLWNLLANELKYAAPYGRVAVRFAADDEVVRVVVADEGPGLSPRDRRRIFRRYYRARSVLRSGKGGFGIGLSTAREFARAMGGDLSVGANRPQGCVFTLTLRRAV